MQDSFLAQVLACPCANHSPVRVRDEDIQCISCETTFPVREGIPVMLLDDATPGPRGIGIPVHGESGS